MKKRASKKAETSKADGITFCEEQQNECKSLVIQGTKYRTLYTKKFANRKKYVNPNEKELFSYIPGTVIEIFVKEGQEVKNGDKILVFEAMKMMNTVTAPFNGKIKKIAVEVNQRMPKGILMYEME